MNEVLANTQLDPARIPHGGSHLADKVAVDEETVRLPQPHRAASDDAGQGAALWVGSWTS